MFLKVIWRRFLKIYQNSQAHLLVSKILFALEFEGFTITYSQFGEDMILEDHFRNQKNGFYVDIGCNRPIQGSNTFRLYLKGWNGINVDGNEKLINKFKKVRKRDINLCEIISNNDAPVSFFLSEDDRVSTISGEFKEWIKEHRSYSKEIKVKPKSVKLVLDSYLPVGQKIDLLNIDVEGHDYEVLCSNDFDKYRPKIICIEDHNFSFAAISENNFFNFLKDKNYTLIGYAYPNLFFKNNLI